MEGAVLTTKSDHWDLNAFYTWSRLEGCDASTSIVSQENGSCQICEEGFIPFAKNTACVPVYSEKKPTDLFFHGLNKKIVRGSSVSFEVETNITAQQCEIRCSNTEYYSEYPCHGFEYHKETQTCTFFSTVGAINKKHTNATDVYKRLAGCDPRISIVFEGNCKVCPKNSTPSADNTVCEPQEVPSTISTHHSKPTKSEALNSVAASSASASASLSPVQTQAASAGSNSIGIKPTVLTASDLADFQFPRTHRAKHSSGEKLLSPQEFRSAAAKAAEAMHAAFEKASEAYVAGDYDGAKAFGLQVQAHRKMMNDLNWQAAELIFDENNRRLQRGFIDLHGLHVGEAVAFTDLAIEDAKAQGLQALHIIAGKGLHSKNGVAQIMPAIKAMIRKYKFSAALHPQNSGELVVKLHRSKL